MDEPNEQAQAAAPETPVATEQPQPEVVIAKVETPAQEPSKALSPTERYLQRKQQPKQETPKTEAVAQPEVTIEPEAPAETVDEAGNPETVDKEQLDDDDGSKPPAKNYRLHTEDPQRAAFYRLCKQNPDANPVDLAKIAGYKVPVVVEEKAAEEVAPAEPVRDPIAELKERLAEVDKQLDEEGDKETLFNKEHVRLIRERSELVSKLDKAEQKRDAAQEAESAKVTTAFEKSKAEAIKVYPDLSDTNSDLGREVSAFISELQTNGNPNSALLDAADAPMVVAQMAATRLAAKMASQQGIPFNDALQSLLAKQEVKKQAPAAAQPPKVQAKPKIQPASGATQASPPPPKQNPPGWDRMSPTQKLQYRYKERGSNRSVGIMV